MAIHIICQCFHPLMSPSTLCWLWWSQATVGIPWFITIAASCVNSTWLHKTLHSIISATRLFALQHTYSYLLISLRLQLFQWSHMELLSKLNLLCAHSLHCCFDLTSLVNLPTHNGKIIYNDKRIMCDQICKKVSYSIFYFFHEVYPCTLWVSY